MFSYVLVGDESLTLWCGEVLKQAGHRLAAVVTLNGAIREWAGAQHAPILEPGSASELEALPKFDYLLSVLSSSPLPSHLLELSEIQAIAFHDGPLPRHPEANAAVRAILEGDSFFGVTWHTVPSAGGMVGVLEEEGFPIEPDASVAALNLQCLQAAQQSFERLVEVLESRAMTVRTCNPSTPMGTGTAIASVLDFEVGAESLLRTIRALSFGSYRNPVGVPKIVGPSGAICIGEGRFEGGTSSNPVGTLSGKSSTELVIAMEGGSLFLSHFKALDGSPLTPDQALESLGATVGDRLPALSAADRARVESLSCQVAQPDAAALSVIDGAELPRLPVNRPMFNDALELATTPSALSSTELRPAALLAAFGSMLTSLTGARSRFDVLGDRTLDGPNNLLFREAVPFAVDGSVAPAEAVRAAESALASVCVSADLGARSPQAAVYDEGSDRAAIVLGSGRDHDLQAYGLVLVHDTDAGTFWKYSTSRFNASDVETFDEMLRERLEFIAGKRTETPSLAPARHITTLEALNSTTVDYDRELTIPEQFERAVQRHPKRTAVTGGGRSLTYRELNARANLLADSLRSLGVGPDLLVAVHMERSIDMLVALIGIHKAGGAYVPVDPTYPDVRKRLMIEDSKAQIVLTSAETAARTDFGDVQTMVVDAGADASGWGTNVQQTATPESLAYVLYTSGSTGRPKGVMVEHRNVLNFFAGMDERIGTEAGTWLSVTSISFDISVLELLWTVTRGFTVVINGAKNPAAKTGPSFSLFFFSSEAGSGQKAYDLVMRASKFADERGFEAVWTPERHFHAFGGAFPNPSVLSAAIAATTSNVKIRSGSCVLPLHSPIRVAEEWSVVDNISNGRVGISFAAGWQPDDFVLRPESFGRARSVMERDIPVVQALWRGDAQSFDGPEGRPVVVQTLPRPIQSELPVWITSAGDPETFRLAGRMGANVLTHLLGQSVEGVAERIEAYREAWKEAGHSGRGQVTMMLHTYIDDDNDRVKETVRAPMIRYLGSSVGLIKQFASSFPAFKRLPQDQDPNDLLQSLSAEEMHDLMEVAFERYYQTSGLFGTPERATEMVDRLEAIGVDEIACLVDFGVPSEDVMAGLDRLAALMDSLMERSGSRSGSVGELIRDHEVTHLQCTPSMASLMLADEDTRAAFGQLQVMMVGGEALPAHLAQELVRSVDGRVINMYGPTETTIWSTTCEVNGGTESCPIGTPIANTSIYILNERLELMPNGMIGELWIGGDGVTRGYLGREDLTAERFVADPFGHAQSRRMYRTGDLARVRADGLIEFLGRVDQQVKVRGYRIEPSEIESAMLTVPGVTDAVVIAREDDPGDVRLVGYFVPGGGDEPSVDVLRSAVGTALPAYMVPTNFVRLDAIPLTPNAKVDRKALPQPALRPAAAATVVVSPVPDSSTVEVTSETLELVESTWADVLRVQTVPTDRSFFDLGGNSLLLIQVHNRLHAHHPALRVTDLYKYPTISSLATHLSGNPGSTNGSNDSQSRASFRRAAREARPVRG